MYKTRLFIILMTLPCIAVRFSVTWLLTKFDPSRSEVWPH